VVCGVVVRQTNLQKIRDHAAKLEEQLTFEQEKDFETPLKLAIQTVKEIKVRSPSMKIKDLVRHVP
jgi:hypothetical protein